MEIVFSGRRIRIARWFLAVLFFGVHVSIVDATINHLIGNCFKNCISLASDDKNVPCIMQTRRNNLRKYFI